MECVGLAVWCLSKKYISSACVSCNIWGGKMSGFPSKIVALYDQGWLPHVSNFVCDSQLFGPIHISGIEHAKSGEHI